MKKNYFKSLLNGAFVLLFSLSLSVATAQSGMYVSNGNVLHYSGGNFASGIIDNTHGGAFSVSSDYAYSADNYVTGPVSFLAAGGTYNVSLEAGALDRVPNFTSTGAATISYAPTTVPTGAAPTGYVLANAELYTFTGSVSAGSATPFSSTGFGTATGTLVTVFANANGGTWSTTATAGATTVMSFAKEDATISTATFNLEKFVLYPNPVNANATSINFNLPSKVQTLSVTMYDVTGKVVQRYNNVAVQAGTNSINKPLVAKGLYLLQFSFNNGEQQVTKRVIIE